MQGRGPPKGDPGGASRSNAPENEETEQIETLKATGERAGEEERIVTLSAESGLVYVADNGAHAAEVAERFGHAVMEHGEVLATTKDRNRAYEWRDLDLHTDDGLVSPLPGPKPYSTPRDPVAACSSTRPPRTRPITRSLRSASVRRYRSPVIATAISEMGISTIRQCPSDDRGLSP